MGNILKSIWSIADIRSQDWHHKLPWLAMIVTLLISVLAWQLATHVHQNRIHEQFDNLASEQANSVNESLEHYELTLRGAAGLFAASESVERDEWHNYFESLLAPKYLSGMQGLGYALVVPKSMKAQHEAAMRAQGFPDYAIYPPGDREMYTSIIYIEPFSGRNLRAFSYDMFSEPIRRKALELARDTGEATYSGKITLVQEVDQKQKQAGFLLYLPVYRKGTRHNTLESRRAALIGFVYFPFRVGDWLNNVFRDPNRSFEVALYDNGVAPENLMYESMPGLTAASYVADKKIELGGRTWVLRVFSNENFMASSENQIPKIILWIGIGLSLLLFIFLRVNFAQKKIIADSNEVGALRTREMEVHARMTELLLSCDSMEEAKPIIINALIQLFSEERGAVYLMDESTDMMVSVIQWSGFELGESDNLVEMFNLGDCWALKRGAFHAANFGHFDNICCKHVSHSDSAYMCVPITIQGKILGVLHVEDHFKNRTRQYNEHLMGLAKTVASGVSLSLSNLKLRESLTALAMRDTLTGLYNRRFMQEAVSREMLRVRRIGTQIAVAMIDVDYFKKFNDTYGHDAGDTVLREIGKLLKEFRQGEDIACRYGGEEFLLALTDVDPDRAANRLEKLRQLVESLSLYHEGKLLPEINISVGVALFPGDAHSLDRLIKLADTALYKAKEAGRNRVVFASANKKHIETNEQDNVI